MHQQPPSGRVAGPNDAKSNMRETAAGDPPGLRDQVSHLGVVAPYESLRRVLYYFLSTL